MKNELNAYLTFALGEEKFAIPVEHVQEVVEYGHVTKVPQAPLYMLGIINLRGKVLPLMDTKIKLGLPATIVTGRSRILVLDLQTLDGKDLQVGALVDVAREVVEIASREILDAPAVKETETSAPITGVVNDHGNITMIMDISRVFSNEDILDFNKPVIQ